MGKMNVIQLHIFLYLLPCEYFNEVDIYDIDDEAFEDYRFINGQVSVEVKLLFVDVMRFFGINRPRHQERKYINKYKKQRITFLRFNNKSLSHVRSRLYFDKPTVPFISSS